MINQALLVKNVICLLKEGGIITADEEISMKELVGEKVEIWTKRELLYITDVQQKRKHN